jgi:hypothetical protein
LQTGSGPGLLRSGQIRTQNGGGRSGRCGTR